MQEIRSMHYIHTKYIFTFLMSTYELYILIILYEKGYFKINLYINHIKFFSQTILRYVFGIRINFFDVWIHNLNSWQYLFI
jgi:hypothetical protein